MMNRSRNHALPLATLLVNSGTLADLYRECAMNPTPPLNSINLAMEGTGSECMQFHHHVHMPWFSRSLVLSFQYLKSMKMDIAMMSTLWLGLATLPKSIA